VHRFILHNEDIREASDKVLSPGQVGLLSGWGVFSTIKVCDGVLFAWERHWARMKRDAALLHVPLPEDSERVRLQLLKLLDANHATDATLRVVVVRNSGGMWQGPSTGRASDLIALSADLKDWGSGVKLTYAPQARHSQCAFAGTKVLAWSFNLTWLEDAQARGFDEVILLNEHGEVSECTSANLFIAKGREVFTPPLSSGCLPGVTRDLLLSDVRLAEYPVTERVIKPGDLENADEVFITSTTRDLLPVLEIDGKKIRNAGKACASLKQAFGDYVSRYVADHRAVSVR
jgi:branched-chain amino acid aminotransferase